LKKPDLTILAVQEELKPLDTSNIFRDKKSIIWVHCGEAYSVKITSNDKLILTK